MHARCYFPSRGAANTNRVPDFIDLIMVFSVCVFLLRHLSVCFPIVIGKQHFLSIATWIEIKVFKQPSDSIDFRTNEIQHQRRIPAIVLVVAFF